MARFIRVLLAGAVATAVSATAVWAAPAEPARTVSFSTKVGIGGEAIGPPTVSANWAGYVATDPTGSTSSTSFTSVTGTWTQPRATCTAGKAAYSATWVGLGGFAESSPALEQIGTSADCSPNGKATYYAWYELVPAPPVRFKLKVVPGDTITTSVNVNGSSVLVQIKNRTRHTTFTKQLDMAAQPPDLSSAEWVEEAPSSCSSTERCRVLPLANFGSVSFGRSATIANGHPGTISDPAWTTTPVQLVPDSGSAAPFGTSRLRAGAAPTTLSADGRSFGVAWQDTAASGG